MKLADGIVAAVNPLTVTISPSTVASPAAALNSAHLAVGDFVQVLVQGANRLVVGSTNGRVGVVSYTRKTSDASGISATVAAITPPSMTMVAGRRYEFSLEALCTGTVAGDLWRFGVVDVGSGLYHKQWFWTVPPTSGLGVLAAQWITETSMSGSVQWRIDVALATGTGTLTVHGGAITPNATFGSAPRWTSLKIADVGPL